MTALQDWLSSSPVDPRHLPGAIRGAWRELTGGDARDDDEPQLMGPGLQRC